MKWISMMMLENVDTDTYGDKKSDHVIWYRVKCIIDMFFKDENVAQIFLGPYITSLALYCY